jgi:D-arginine dehydrogenase
MSESCYDILVIGGGIAGASAAGCLSRVRRVAVIERELQPGYHSTGRSAAVFSEVYGSAQVRALSRASGPFLREPPAEFSDQPLLSPRGALFVARADQLRSLDTFSGRADVAAATHRLSGAEARAISPLLRKGYVVAAAFEPGASDINVHALHHGYLRQLHQAGGRIVTDAEVLGLDYSAGHWRLDTSKGRYSAPIIVNAAGAWVDQVAALAGVAPIGIKPLRRTAVIVDPPIGLSIERCPLTIDVDESFYFKPEGRQLLLSPADESFAEPCDAQPEELDVAHAVHRVEQATTLEVLRVLRRWAGLRSFVADRDPVIGYEPAVKGFFWLAGIGGYGLQTAPAVGRLAAALILAQSAPGDLIAAGLNPGAIAPERIRLVVSRRVWEKGSASQVRVMDA